MLTFYADVVPDRKSQELRLMGLDISMERLTYATVVLRSVLVVYDGWQELTTFWGLVAVILGPLVALAVAHFFADPPRVNGQRMPSLSSKRGSPPSCFSSCLGAVGSVVWTPAAP